MARRTRPSPALVIALIALFVSLGGVGYAATKIDTEDIKGQAVTKPKIAKKAVSTGKLAAQAVKTGKIAADAVRSGKINDGAVKTNNLADQGVTTDKLADQAVTTDKLADVSVTAPKLADTVETELEKSISAGFTASLAVSCPAGGQAISSGFTTHPDVQVLGMNQIDDSSWGFAYRNNGAVARTVVSRVICLVG